MDSGASLQTANHLKKFPTILEIIPVSVQMADNTSVTAKENGKVTLDVKSFHGGQRSTTRIIHTTFYTSLGQLRASCNL